MGGSSTRPRSTSAWSGPREMPSSSVDSSSNPLPCLNNSTANGDHEEAKSSYLDTDLSLGLGGNIHIPRIEPLPRSTIDRSFLVKVFMEGVTIGRKIDVFAHNNYDDIIASLDRMFNTNIHRPGERAAPNLLDKLNVLTYEDKDGDWMMVGDVPWEMFKCTVKRMMITSADKC